MNPGTDAGTPREDVGSGPSRAFPETGQVSLAVVCCEGTGELALFDLSTGDLMGTITVGSHPVHATVHRGRVFVATMGERSIAAVDLDGGVTRIDTGVLGPSHFASVGVRLFIPCTAGDSLAVVDADELALERRVGVGTEPHDIATHCGRVFVGSRGDGAVSVVDGVELAEIATVSLGIDARTQGVAVHEGTDTVLAVDQRNATMCAFADDADAVDSRHDVGPDPYELSVHGDRVYVPGRGDGTVHQFSIDPDRSPEERLVAESVHDGFETPVEVCTVDAEAWVVDRGRPALRSVDGRSIETPAPAIAATRVGDRLLLSHYDDAAVSLVDLAEGVVWRSDAPAYPFGSLVV